MAIKIYFIGISGIPWVIKSSSWSKIVSYCFSKPGCLCKYNRGLENCSQGTNGLMLMKFDMMKAYNRLQWGFVQKALFYWGFSEVVQTVILSCIETVKYSLLLNGGQVGNITPERGIWQKDPLSPFLFILCAEVLTKTIQQNTNIQGIKICKNALIIPHLFFADDMLLACRTDLKHAKAVRKCLYQYCEWSGQAMNLEKSQIFFLVNCSNKVKNSIKEVLGLKEMPRDSIYLGNTLLFGKNKTKEFHNLKSRIQGRLEGWRCQLLS